MIQKNEKFQWFSFEMILKNYSWLALKFFSCIEYSFVYSWIGEKRKFLIFHKFCDVIWLSCIHRRTQRKRR